MPYVSAVIFIFDAFKNLSYFEEELKDPCFKEYNIFFLGDVPDEIIRKIADFDKNDLVNNVQKLFNGYYGINHNFFVSGVDKTENSNTDSNSPWN